MSASGMRMADGKVSRKFYQQTNPVACCELHRPRPKTTLTIRDTGPQRRSCGQPRRLGVRRLQKSDEDLAFPGCGFGLPSGRWCEIVKKSYAFALARNRTFPSCT